MDPQTSRRARWIASLEKRFASAAVLLETNDQRLLIVKSGYKQYWSLPGGIIDAGEAPLEAAAREVREEVGIVLQPGDLTFRWVAFRDGDDAQSYQFVFHTIVDEAEIAGIKLQAAEVDESALVTRDDVLSGDRPYGHAIVAWAKNQNGYLEQDFTRSGV